MNTCLIVKTSSLGDLVHTFPVISYLKQRFPAIQIDWVVEEQCADLVSAHPLIHHCIPIATKRWRQGWLSQSSRQEISSVRRQLQKEKYDLVLDLQGNIKSAVITYLTNAAKKVGFGQKTVPEWPNTWVTHQRFNPPPALNIRDSLLYLVRSYFADFENECSFPGVQLRVSQSGQAQIEATVSSCPYGKTRVMVCPGSAWKNKQLPFETLRDLLPRMQARWPLFFLFLWGNAEEKATAEKLHRDFPDSSIILEKMALPTLQNLMSRLDLVIAMDSLPLHLAATTGVATFSLFGASSAQKYAPLGSQHLAFQGQCPYGRTFEKRCPILRSCPTGNCIRSLSADQILKFLLDNSLQKFPSHL